MSCSVHMRLAIAQPAMQNMPQFLSSVQLRCSAIFLLRSGTAALGTAAQVLCLAHPGTASAVSCRPGAYDAPLQSCAEEHTAASQVASQRGPLSPMDGQLEAVRQDIGSVKDEIVKTKQDLGAAEQAGNKEIERVLLDLLLSLNNQLLSLNETKNILLHRQAPSVSTKVLDVRVLVNSQEDLNMKNEYDVPAGVIRFRDFEEGLGIKVLKCLVYKQRCTKL